MSLSISFTANWRAFLFDPLMKCQCSDATLGEGFVGGQTSNPSFPIALSQREREQKALAAACCWLISFCPFEATQPLSNAGPCLARGWTCPLWLSGLSDRRRHDRFQYRAVRRVFSALALNLRITTGTAHFRLAVLH